MGLVTQGAAVLRHSIQLAHSNNNSSSKYDFQMYALVHPSARECSHQMSKLGYITLIRNTPFEKSEIQTKFLREHVDGASCCGAKEYIKLYAYTLTQHPVAVVLDLDSLVLQPLDDLFDVLIDEKSYEEVINMKETKTMPIHVDNPKRVKMLTNETIKHSRVDAFYTRDYNMVNPGGEMYAGVQGGFLMVRPNEATFEEYVDLILRGDYREGQGWGGKYGYFFGGMQIQGICSYYYEHQHPGNGVELNRCRINSMVDNPHFKESEKKRAKQSCRDGRESCEDCRSTDLGDVLSAHLTICQKPWECHYQWDAKSTGLCRKLHGEWFRIRRSFEEMRTDVDSTLRQLPELEGAFQPEIYHGYCTRGGSGGYLPVKV